MRQAWQISLANLKGRDYLADLGIDRDIILKWELKQLDVKLLTSFIWLCKVQ